MQGYFLRFSNFAPELSVCWQDLRYNSAAEEAAE